MNEKLTVDVSALHIREIVASEQEEATRVLLEGGVDELVELCRKYFETLGTVPKISTEAGNLLMEVVQFKDLETRRYLTFEKAFDVVNDWPLKDLDPTLYIHRAKGMLGDRHVEASQFHLQAADDPEAAKCRAVTAGENGYQLVLKPKPLLQSRTCTNCLHTKTIKE